MAGTTDWNQIKEWDSKYLLHPFVTAEEYSPCFIERTEGDYLIMPDGTKLLDMFNQLYCVNIGQRVPEVQQAIKDALDRFGFVWDLYATDYKAEVAKLLVEDILGEEGWASKVRFTNTGGESVEVAAIIARLFTGKEFIATREHSYHGITGTAVGLNRVLSGRSHISRESDKLVRQVPGQGYGGDHQVSGAVVLPLFGGPYLPGVQIRAPPTVCYPACIPRNSSFATTAWTRWPP